MPRTKSFDPEVVLDRAIDVFWQKGYDAASVEDLTRAMGINRFSMYNTFGDKRSLFFAALDKYHTGWVEDTIPKLSDPSGGIDGLLAQFESMADMATEANASRCGCMMVLLAAAQAPRDEDCAERVRHHTEQFTHALQTALEGEPAQRELRPGLDAASAARFLTVVCKGMFITAAGGITRDDMLAVVRHAIDSIRSAG